MKKLPLITILLAAAVLATYGYHLTSSTAQSKSSPKTPNVKSDGIWVAEWNAAFIKAKAEQKPVFVDFYTDWCGWCKKLDKETYADDTVQKKLREEWVTVKVNAEDNSKRGTFDGNVMTYPQLAQAFGVTGYPTLLFIDKEGKPVGAIPGFLDAKQFVRALDFYKQEMYKKNINIEQYILNGKVVIEKTPPSK